MRLMIILTLLSLLLIGGVAASRYVPYPYNSVQDYFEDRYQDRLDNAQKALPAPPASYVDQRTGQLMVFRPSELNYGGFGGYPLTQKVYARVSNAGLAVQIEEGSVEDGYNRGYFAGFDDGLILRSSGYNAYFDYVEAHKVQQDAKREGYYVFADRQVKIEVAPGNDAASVAYREGVLQGFKDAFYNVEYKGLNADYYAYQAQFEKYPGQYVPAPAPVRFGNSYRTFPAFASYTSGVKFYGLNYR